MPLQIDESKLFPPEPTAAGRRPPSQRPRTKAPDRLAIIAIAVAAAIGGILASSEPAGWWVADAVFRGAAAAILTFAGSRARRSTWLWASGVATVSAPDPMLAVVGLAAMSLAIAAQLLDRRKRVEGALVLALSSQVLLRLGDTGFFGASILLAVLAATPTLVSAYRVAPRRVRRRVQISVWAFAGVMAAGLACFAFSSGFAAARLDQGVADARAGLDEARNGHDSDAAESLAKAAESFDEANDFLTAWWAAPARAVPLVGHQARAAAVATEEGGELAHLAADTAEAVPVEELEFEDGRLDLDLVRAAAAPLEDTAQALAAANERLEDIDSAWLMPPFSGRLDDLQEAVADARPDAALAADVAAVAPSILGGEGTRHYFVVFTTPAESRGLGGFMGNWAELTAEDGKVTLTASGRSEELNDVAETTHPTVSAEPDGQRDQRLVDYLDRYHALGAWDSIQDVTVSPDFPTVAEVVRQLYPQMGGTELDGVLVVDPYALAALMRFTGPIRIEGLDQPLNHRNAADFLLSDQYTNRRTEDRADVLDEASREVFEALTTGDLPNPRQVSSRLSPLARQGRIGVVSFHDDEQELFHGLGIDAAMPSPHGVDSFGLVTSNGGHNKIDVYLERTVKYETTVDPDSGDLDAHVTIELENAVPSLDLPDAVIGNNDQGFPPGTNEALVSFYTPHQLQAGTVDGAEVGFRSNRELGYWVFATVVQIPPGGHVVLELDLHGQVSSFKKYEIQYLGQPLVNADDVSIEVALATDWHFKPGKNDELISDADSQRAVGEPQGREDQILSIKVRKD